MTVLDELARSRYISITTYRKDGRGVATPVWHAVAGDEMFIWTGADTWKVKRIRNDARVVVTACDLRGRIEEGAPSLEGTARLLGEPDTGSARELIARKYVLARLSKWIDKISGRGDRGRVIIAVTL